MQEKNVSSVLKAIQKPGRYIGGEYNGVMKDKESVKCRFAFCFPDTYEIGMSNLGVRILYDALNREEDIWCERVYAPWTDMKEKMEEYSIPLASVESGDPLKAFDMVAFSLQYELCYTTALAMLDLAGIPLYSKEREEGCPIIIGGGPCVYNAEPVADFFDLINIGEGEEVLVEICKLYNKMKDEGSFTREAFLRAAAKIEGVYIPSFYEVSYNEDGTITEYRPIYDDLPKKIRKRIIGDLDSAPYPEKLVMPYIETVHDRIVLEVYRGCIRGCRFCQAGFIYRPVRERTVDNAFSLCTQLLQNTGYDELSLNSLSTGDYSGLSQLLDKLLPYAAENNVQLNLPSLRVDSFKGDFASGNRKSSLTFAPEAGTQRLRDVINKNITEEEILSAAASAFQQGYASVKLYFMMGLPTETQEDIDGIFNLVMKIKSLYKTHKTSAKALRISVSCSTFIPKPFTPFQWEAFATREYVEENQRYLAEKFRQKGVAFSYNDYNVSLLEAILARGGRQIADSLYQAYKNGALFDAWSEHYNWENYRQAFEQFGVDINAIVGAKSTTDVLPWDYVDVGVQKLHLLCERNRAYSIQTTPTCNQSCRACGLHKWGFCQDTHGNVRKGEN